jgi:very-short-patch-repair endonuclease
VRDRTQQGVVYRDHLLAEFGLAIELDGHAWHGDPVARARDMSRDLAAAGQGLFTIRLGWTHIREQPCTTAAGLTAVLQQRGWEGTAHGCSRGCPVGSIAVTG